MPSSKSIVERISADAGDKKQELKSSSELAFRQFIEWACLEYIVFLNIHTICCQSNMGLPLMREALASYSCATLSAVVTLNQ